MINYTFIFDSNKINGFISSYATSPTTSMQSRGLCGRYEIGIKTFLFKTFS